ncbi:hypothetical protein Tco_1375387 [Tanacetum coccineum]
MAIYTSRPLKSSDSVIQTRMALSPIKSVEGENQNLALMLDLTKWTLLQIFVETTERVLPIARTFMIFGFVAIHMKLHYGYRLCVLHEITKLLKQQFVIHDAGGVHREVMEVLKPWVEKGYVKVQDIRDEEWFGGYYHNQFLIVNDCLHI